MKSNCYTRSPDWKSGCVTLGSLSYLSGLQFNYLKKKYVLALQELLCQSSAESAEDRAVFTCNPAELAIGFLCLGSLLSFPSSCYHLPLCGLGMRTPHIWLEWMVLTSVCCSHLVLGGNPRVQIYRKHAAWHEHRHSCQENPSFLTKKQITGRTLLMPEGQLVDRQARPG